MTPHDDSTDGDLRDALAAARAGMDQLGAADRDGKPIDPEHFGEIADVMRAASRRTSRARAVSDDLLELASDECEAALAAESVEPVFGSLTDLCMTLEAEGFDPEAVVVGLARMIDGRLADYADSGLVAQLVVATASGLAIGYGLASEERS